MNFAKLIKSTANILSLFILLAIGNLLHGQGLTPSGETDTANNAQDSIGMDQLKIDPAYLSFEYMELGIDSFAKWDSTFAFSHRYNRHYQRVQPFADLGYSTSPHKILLNPSLQRFGFQSGFTQYQGTDLDPEKATFYQASVPQTSFDYVQGSGAFIELNAMHTQNFSPTWNFTIRFNNHSNNDELYNTQSNTNHIHRGSSLANAFKTKNGKFEQYTILSWNRARRNESYGYDTASEKEYYNKRSDDTLYQPVGFYYPNLTSAGSIYKTHHHMVLNKWNFTKNTYLFYTLKHQKTAYEFSNAGTNDSVILGGNGFFTESETVDSSVWQQWNNQVGFGGKILNQKLLYQAGLEYTRGSFTTRYKTESDLFYQSAIHAKLYSDPHLLPNQTLRAEASFLVIGAQAGDYKLSSVLGQKWKSWDVYAGLDIQNHSPFQKQVNWANNFHTFNSNLKKTQIQNIKAGIAKAGKKLDLAADLTIGNANNVTYLDSNVQYDQTGSVQSFSLNTKAIVSFGKWHFDNQILFQTNSENEFLNVPKLTLLSSIYYQNQIFKKAMRARIGADFYFQSENKMFRYNASVAEFSLTNELGGNYPIADVFIDGQVKNFNFFLKLEYWNSNLVIQPFAKEFNSSLYEPTLPLNFKLGISWRFFN